MTSRSKLSISVQDVLPSYNKAFIFALVQVQDTFVANQRTPETFPYNFNFSYIDLTLFF